MAAQDEGHIPLGRLPLADLKTWLEDNLALNAASTILGGGGGGTGGTVVTINNFTEIGVLRETGLVVPQAKFITESVITCADNDVLLSRFIPPRDMTVSGCKIAEYQNPTGTSKLDVGIYDTDGSTLLGSSGAVAHSGSNLPAWASYNFTANITLSAGHEYAMGYLNKINTGTWKYIGGSADSAWRSLYLAGVATVAQYMAQAWTARFLGTGWSALANNVAGAASSAATGDAPIAVLTIV